VWDLPRHVFIIRALIVYGSNMKTAAILFSGGALRGYSQFGAMKAIEEFLKKNDSEINTIIGTSFGAITAALVALGYDSEQLIKDSKKKGFNLFNIIDVKIFGPGILRGRKIENEIKRYVGNKTFQDTKHELKINSVDLLTGKEYIFTKDGLVAADGSNIIPDKNIRLVDAILASISIPVLFRPKKIENLLLADGGLISPVAINLIDTNSFDKTFIVDVSMANISFVEPKKEPRKLDLLKQSISIMQRQFHFEKLEILTKNKDNVYWIRPNIGPERILRNGEMNRLIDTGYEETKKILGLK
jgi:NTE family protein